MVLKIVMPRRYVSLDDALSLIRSRFADGHEMLDLIEGDLREMPFKELDDAAGR